MTDPARSSPSVLVIGGGFSGLAAAAVLAQEGRAVTLIEQRRTLGGRASSFLDRASGQWIDNGQHLLMGCYTETFRFLKTIGAYSKIRLQDNLRIDFLDPQGGYFSLACLPLPAPLHLLSGLLRLRHLPWSDRIKMGRIRTGLSSLAGETAGQWLRRMGQSETARRDFWEILVLAALNEPLDTAPASLLIRVLQEAFFTGRDRSVIAIPTVDLTHLLEAGVTDFLDKHGGRILRGRVVAEMPVHDGRVQGLRLNDGTSLSGDAYLSTIPPRDLTRILPRHVLPPSSPLCRLEDYRPSPILTICLWIDRPILDRPFVALLHSPIQWVFQKEGYLSLVISGAREYLAWTDEQLAAMAMTEMLRFFPHSKDDRFTRHRIIRNRFATFSPPRGNQSLRPAAATPIPNLFLAGDWTDTGLPCTIEGAVRSGHRAATAILQRDRQDI